MSRKMQENIIALAVLGFFVGILVLSLGYGPRARLVPIPVSIFGIILSLAQIVWQNRRSAGELHVDILSVLIKDNTGKEPAQEPTTWSLKKQVLGLLVIAGLLVMFILIGPFPSIFLFVTGYLTISGYTSIGKAVAMAAALTAVLWLLFVLVLKIQVYWGILDPLADALGL